jgi:DNA polymerase III epsilon subunit family exonuclease
MKKLSEEYDQRWDSFPFISLDTETTGFGKNDRICEIAMLMIQGDKVVDEFHSLVNPERVMNESARAVHGILDDALQDAPRFDEIRDQVIEFLSRGAPWVAHQLSFDARMLSYVIPEDLWPKGVPTLCSMDFAKKHHSMLRMCNGHKLMNLAGYLQIDYRAADAHSAKVDATLLGKIVPKMMGTRLVSESYTKLSEEWLK